MVITHMEQVEIRVTGSVLEGTYLEDSRRCRAVVEALEAEGFVVTRKVGLGTFHNAWHLEKRNS